MLDKCTNCDAVSQTYTGKPWKCDPCRIVRQAEVIKQQRNTINKQKKMLDMYIKAWKFRYSVKTVSELEDNL